MKTAGKHIEGKEYLVYQAPFEAGKQDDKPEKLCLKKDQNRDQDRDSREAKKLFFQKLLQNINNGIRLLIRQTFVWPRTWRQSLAFLGNWLVVLSLAGVMFFYAPLWRAEVGYRAQKSLPKSGFGDLLRKGVVHSVEAAPDPYFSLVIPKINARAKIVPNVDASSGRDYTAALREGVAHAKGTVFPGMKGTIYLFAHSTDAPWNIVRHNAVFYLLRELEAGDRVIVFFQGIRYDYLVTEAKVVPSTETGFFSQKEEELLVLQTCHPPGTTREALLVLARRES